jgi:hypothetical protein
LRNITFVEDRKLYGCSWPTGGRESFCESLFEAPVSFTGLGEANSVTKHQIIAIHGVDKKREERKEIENQQEVLEHFHCFLTLRIG